MSVIVLGIVVVVTDVVVGDSAVVSVVVSVVVLGMAVVVSEEVV